MPFEAIGLPPIAHRTRCRRASSPARQKNAFPFSLPSRCLLLHTTSVAYYFLTLSFRFLPVITPLPLLSATMSKSYEVNWSIWRSESGAEVCGTKAEPDRCNFLAFLATAQAFGIELLPLAWDAGRGVIGAGGSARIQQALVDINTSLAFKTYHSRDRTEEQIFWTIINEITILSQPFVRNHTNIAQLQAFCWDISPNDDKPWPVLVFEKSHLGDLHHFVADKGRSMEVHERVKLCLDIARAVMDMHTNGKESSHPQILNRAKCISRNHPWRH